MKTLILLATLCAVAFASYENVENFYNQGEFQKAIDEAKISFSDYSNPKLHMLWAKSAEALGNEDEAMSAYERVEILDETNNEARVALVKIYRESARDEFTSQTIKESQNYQLTPKQRASLELLQGGGNSTFRASVSLSAGYDDNVNVNPGALILDDYYDSVGNEDIVETQFSRLNAKLTYLNELGGKGGWYIQGDAIAYYQNNLDAHYYDMFVGTLEAGIGYAGNGYTAYLPVAYDIVNYLDKSLFEEYGVEPRVNVALSGERVLSLKANYSQRAYLHLADEGRDDSTFGLGVGIYYLFDKNFAYADLKYEKFIATNDSPLRFVNKDALTLALGVNYNVTSWLMTRVDYRYRGAIYDDEIKISLNSDPEKRLDGYHQLEAKVSLYFKRNYELFISNRYSNNSSNHTPGEYVKNVVTLGLGLNY